MNKELLYKYEPSPTLKRNGKGFFIAIDGIDGTGKTTQCALIKQCLTDLVANILVVRELGDTETGEELRNCVLKNRDVSMEGMTAAFLFAASGYELLAKKIIPTLNNGGLVILDRFIASRIAYQIGVLNLDTHFVENLISISTNDIVPDITYVLDIPIEVASQRLSDKKADRYELISDKTKENIAWLYRNFKECDGYVMIDANQPVEVVTQTMVRDITDRLLTIRRTDGWIKSHNIQWRV